MKLTISLFAFVSIFLSDITGQILIPPIFSSGMVLQRDTIVRIWGIDNPDEKISVKGSWGEQAECTSEKNGLWNVEIHTHKAGGPYEIVVEGSEKKILKDVMIGEVWFCSGQSNMEMPVNGFVNQPVINSNETILKSANNNLRLFKVEKEGRLSASSEITGNWETASPATTGNFSATAYYFGKTVQETLGVPVGLIVSAWGASDIKSWMSKNALMQFKDVEIPDAQPEKQIQKAPCLLYNGMVSPYKDFAIKGVIWYQGEANRLNPVEYKLLFPAMITDWRDTWKNADLPFYFVQIAPFNYREVNSAYLREAQMETMLKIRHAGMAVTLDVGESECIHPSAKEDVGFRLALWALADSYGIKGIEKSGPIFKKLIKEDNNKLKLYFQFASGGLTSFENGLKGFFVAGNDSIYYPAEAKINKDKTLSVWSEKVENPVSVRYSFDNLPEATLYNTAGLPASSFRTDDY